MQKKISEGLDELIQEASKQSGRARKGASVRRRHRRPPRRRPRPASKSDGQSARAGPTPKAGKGAAGDGRDGGRDKTKTNKADLARRWGFLPEHDRLEISQGFDEEFLPKFRERILRYYRELAEQGRRE